MTHNTARVFISAAKRTAVAPRNGLFGKMEAADLAAPVLKELIAAAGIPGDKVDQVILGNALFGGGNPARIAALAAGIDQSVPALTIDSQCCGGLDAIALGASLIASRQAHVILAGGLESYSRSPIRVRRPREPHESPVAYSRPAFTPWPDADPDMIEAAAALAEKLCISRDAQQAFAVASHAKAFAAQLQLQAREIISVAGMGQDAFTRVLSPAMCQRLPIIAGNTMHGLTAATIAVEADAAAAVLLVSEEMLNKNTSADRPVEWIGTKSAGGDPQEPGLVPVAVARSLLAYYGQSEKELAVVEIMEAFAAQAMAFVDAFSFSPESINPGGGALARGHPIGASGAILAVRMFHELQKHRVGSSGLVSIAAAGGLGSAALLRI